jgi:hypothetical protein
MPILNFRTTHFTFRFTHFGKWEALRWPLPRTTFQIFLFLHIHFKFICKNKHNMNKVIDLNSQYTCEYISHDLQYVNLPKDISQSNLRVNLQLHDLTICETCWALRDRFRDTLQRVIPFHITNLCQIPLRDRFREKLKRFNFSERLRAPFAGIAPCNTIR